MDHERIYRVDDHLRSAGEGDEPLRSVVTESEQAAVVAWIVLPGQRIASHVHPHGQDTWIVLRGRGDYAIGDGAVRALVPGDIAIARTGDVHGVYNAGPEPFVFMSVVSPGQAGYERIAEGGVWSALPALAGSRSGSGRFVVDAGRTSTRLAPMHDSCAAQTPRSIPSRLHP